MKKHGVFQLIKKDQVPKNAKILTSTWSMKQKADGTKRARLNARGYEQVTGVHYNETGVSSPVVNEASIFILFTLMVMARMYGELNDVKGAILNGNFTHGEKLYMEIPEGFEWFYPTGVLLLLLKTIYGLKQSAFEITGENDSTFASDPITKRSVSVWSAMLNNVSYTRKSKM